MKMIGAIDLYDEVTEFCINSSHVGRDNRIPIGKVLPHLTAKFGKPVSHQSVVGALRHGRVHYRDTPEMSIVGSVTGRRGGIFLCENYDEYSRYGNDRLRLAEAHTEVAADIKLAREARYPTEKSATNVYNLRGAQNSLRRDFRKLNAV
jgi:hypothetical protein